MTRLEKWIATDGGWWWKLPHAFETREAAEAFLARLEKANPGQAFRVAPSKAVTCVVA